MSDEQKKQMRKARIDTICPKEIWITAQEVRTQCEAALKASLKSLADNDYPESNAKIG